MEENTMSLSGESRLIEAYPALAPIMPVFNRLIDVLAEAGYEGDVFYPPGEPPYAIINDETDAAVVTVLSDEDGGDMTILARATVSFEDEDESQSKERFEKWQEEHDFTSGYFDSENMIAELVAAVPVINGSMPEDGAILNFIKSFLQEAGEL